MKSPTAYARVRGSYDNIIPILVKTGGDLSDVERRWIGESTF